jgi:hypothetical protein
MVGWVYDTSVAMVHMVMAGVFQRYPNLKVLRKAGMEGRERWRR